jgi:hypothetical protein
MKRRKRESAFSFLHVSVHVSSVINSAVKCHASNEDNVDKQKKIFLLQKHNSGPIFTKISHDYLTNMVKVGCLNYIYKSPN